MNDAFEYFLLPVSPVLSVVLVALVLILIECFFKGRI
mgnify:CR=1 FL=1